MARKLFGGEAPAPKDPVPEEVKKQLANAAKGVAAALAIIGMVWEECAEARTTRLADAVNLLDRAMSKLNKESGEMRP